MKITLCSIFVDDQQKALDFYTGILGFIKSQEIPVGEFRWLTVKSPEGGETELSLEPNANPAPTNIAANSAGVAQRADISISTVSTTGNTK